MKFDFGGGSTAAGYTQVVPSQDYSESSGYGFEPGGGVQSSVGGGDALGGDACVSDRPFLFSVDLPEGNYWVAVTFGDPHAESVNTVRAEDRRLMLEKIEVMAGETAQRTFAVSVRTPEISRTRKVSLKDKEWGSQSWDERLTLEFNGKHPAVSAIEIEPAEDVTTVFIAGDSTVTDQSREPWAGWGQMLPRFFEPGVVVTNLSQSGLTLKSFAGQRRLDKILRMMKPGDYIFIQFGHNDMKEKGEGIGPFESYSDSLREYITKARRQGGIPVLVTSMHRRWFNDDGTVKNTLGDYPEAVRRVAAEQDVALIDLNEMSQAFYEALGKNGSRAAFVHYPANTFPGQAERLRDDSHHNAYGAYGLALCVVKGIRDLKLGLADHLTDDAPVFNPSKPQDPDTFELPLSPFAANIETPEGS